jgi:WD40 repeat protein
MVAVLTKGARAAWEGAPYLMLDTGGHAGGIRSIAFTPDGKQLVSAGDDKVIRVWDWQAGKTARIIRGEVAPGTEGKYHVIALSPDGRWLAAGGWMAPGFGVRNSEVGSIRLFDFRTGELVGLLSVHTDAVNSLTFSADGKLLLSGGFDNTERFFGMLLVVGQYISCTGTLHPFTPPVLRAKEHALSLEASMLL